MIFPKMISVRGWGDLVARNQLSTSVAARTASSPKIVQSIEIIAKPNCKYVSCNNPHVFHEYPERKRDGLDENIENKMQL